MAMRPLPGFITPQLLLMVRPSELLYAQVHKHVHKWDVAMHTQHGSVHVSAIWRHTAVQNLLLPCDLHSTF